MKRVEMIAIKEIENVLKERPDILEFMLCVSELLKAKPEMTTFAINELKKENR